MIAIYKMGRVSRYFGGYREEIINALLRFWLGKSCNNE